MHKVDYKQVASVWGYGMYLLLKKRRRIDLSSGKSLIHCCKDSCSSILKMLFNEDKRLRRSLNPIYNSAIATAIAAPCEQTFKAHSHCSGNANILSHEIVATVHTKWIFWWQRQWQILYFCVWFAPDSILDFIAVAVAVGYHVNSTICLHTAHSGRQKFVQFPLSLPPKCERTLA